MTEDITALLLVGGKGTRLRSAVPSLPKPLAPVAGRPFLAYVIAYLRNQGVRKFVLCTGYMAEKLEDVFGDGSGLGVSIVYSRELEPLGTAGAIRLASSMVAGGSSLLVVNGDTLQQFELSSLLDFHRVRGALVTMVATRVSDASRFGTLHLDSERHVTSFVEKTGSCRPGIINAGIYAVEPALLASVPAGYVSWETTILPRLLPDRLFAQEHPGLFIDIGIPSEYERAQELVPQMVNPLPDLTLCYAGHR